MCFCGVDCVRASAKVSTTVQVGLPCSYLVSDLSLDIVTATTHIACKDYFVVRDSMLEKGTPFNIF